ncbi:MAG TPA: hypothetical protein VFC15_09685 [Candidatus Limnocylindrales bacterium]|nr:hypothetical protein [Candidatus Limnocylindrales bacterium]
MASIEALPYWSIVVEMCACRMSFFRWDRPERKEIVVALDRFELREQCQIRAISGQGFNETGDFLAGGVENTVVAFRVIKAISECPIG